MIIRDFKTAEFCVVPNADVAKLEMYVDEIERWETKAAVHSQST
jgi:hypothetical protein